MRSWIKLVWIHLTSRVLVSFFPLLPHEAHKTCCHRDLWNTKYLWHMVFCSSSARLAVLHSLGLTCPVMHDSNHADLHILGVVGVGNDSPLIMISSIGEMLLMSTFWQVCLTSGSKKHKSTSNDGQTANISLWHLMKECLRAFEPYSFLNFEAALYTSFTRLCNVLPPESGSFLTVLAVGCETFIAFCWIPVVYCNMIKIVTIW